MTTPKLKQAEKISASLKRVGLTNDYLLTTISGAVRVGKSSHKVGDRLTEKQIETLIAEKVGKVTVRNY
jgi:hypothetical protein